MHFGIRAKLLAGVGIVVMMLLIGGASGSGAVTVLGGYIDRIGKEHLIGVYDANEAARTIMEVQADLSKLVRAVDPAVQRARMQDARDDTANFEAQMRAVRRQATDAEELRQLAVADDAWRRATALTEEIAQAVQKGDIRAADELFARWEESKDAADDILTGLAKQRKAKAEEEVESAVTMSTLLRKVIFGASLLAVPLGIVVALVLARTISNAVARVAGAARQIATEDLPSLVKVAQALATGDLTQSAKVTIQHIDDSGHDELSGMARDLNGVIDKLRETGAAFDAMTQSLRKTMGQIKTSSDGLTGASEQLGHAATATGQVVQEVVQAIQVVAAGAQDASASAQASNDAVAQLGHVITSIATGASEQARQVQSVSATATQMVAGVEKVAANAQQVADASRQTQESAELGARAVRETVDGMAEIKQVVFEAANKVEDLGRLGEKIGDVVETIDDIAEQTNLLALNAAIEAARAGEHGRGFAVVADEVRKLAERSQRETRVIADLIREVQIGTRDAVDAMGQGSVRVERGSSKADEAGRALSEILRAVEETVAQVTQIAVAAGTMADDARGVVVAMREINVVVEDNSAATEEMAAQAGQVTAAIASIATTAEQNNAAAEHASSSAVSMSNQIEEMYAQAEELAVTTEQLGLVFGRFRLGVDQNAAAPATSQARTAARTPARNTNLRLAK